MAALRPRMTCWPFLAVLIAPIPAERASCFAVTQLQMSHFEELEVALVGLSRSPAVVCGPRTKLDLREEALYKSRERLRVWGGVGVGEKRRTAANYAYHA